MKYIIGGIFGILLCIGLSSLNGYTAQSVRESIPPCPTEDSDNCYWDAQTMGNGTGTDSVVLNMQLPTK
jgi:hypothetical protein